MELDTLQRYLSNITIENKRALKILKKTIKRDDLSDFTKKDP